MTTRVFLAAAAIGTGLLAAPVTHAADPLIDQLTSMSPDQIRAAIGKLPPEVQDRIRQELSSKSPDQLMSMTPDQLKAAYRGLSSDTKAELKAEWASLPADQKAALKSLDLKALWQQAIARFKAMGPAEKAFVEKILGHSTGADRSPP